MSITHKSRDGGRQRNRRIAMMPQPSTEPVVHQILARTSDGAAGLPGSEERLGIAGEGKCQRASKALKARNLTDRREAAFPMMETR